MSHHRHYHLLYSICSSYPENDITHTHYHPSVERFENLCRTFNLTLKVLVTTIDAQWMGTGDAGSARYEPALLPPCPTTRVLIYSN